MVSSIWENLFSASGKERSIRTSLKENLLFKDLSLLQLRGLEKVVHIRHYRPGETIFKQGEVGVGMYIIASGRVDIAIDEYQSSSGDLRLVPIVQLKAGDFFGELALVENEGRRTATATAHEECILIGFFKPDLMEIIERSPSAGVLILLRLSEALGTRLHQTTAMITELKRMRMP